jgi:hypothetical protein
MASRAPPPQQTGPLKQCGPDGLRDVGHGLEVAAETVQGVQTNKCSTEQQQAVKASIMLPIWGVDCRRQ